MNRIIAILLARTFIVLAVGCVYVLSTVELVGVDAFGIFMATLNFLLLASACSLWAHCEWQEIVRWSRYRWS